MVQRQPRCKICKRRLGILEINTVCSICLAKPKFKVEISEIDIQDIRKLRLN